MKALGWFMAAGALLLMAWAGLGLLTSSERTTEAAGAAGQPIAGHGSRVGDDALLSHSDGDPGAVAPASASPGADPGAGPQGNRREGVASKQPVQNGFLVRVFQSDGQPASGIAVELLLVGFEQELDDALSSTRPMRIQIADDHGAARFRELRDLTAGVQAARQAGPIRWLLRARANVLEPVYQVLGEDELAIGECELRLPTCAGVRVRVIEVSGEPAGEGFEISLCAKVDAESGAPNQNGETSKLKLPSDENGEAIFPYVQAGRDYVVSAQHIGAGGIALPEFLFVESPGQLLDVAIQMGKGHPVLRFRVLAEDGEVLRNMKLKVRRFGMLGEGESFGVQTSPTGHLDLNIDSFYMLVGRFVFETESGTYMEGQFRVSQRLDEGVQDQGDLMLYTPVQLASGVVVRPDGSPMEGADVSVTLGDSRRDGIQPLRCVSAADGSFSFEGNAYGQAATLWAEKEGWRSKTLHLEPGAEGVRVELEQRCRVSANITAPAGAIPFLRFKLCDADGKAVQEVNQGSSGLVKMGGVVPGRYEFFCYLDDRLIFGSGEFEVAGDYSIGSIDLTPQLFKHELTLLGLSDDSPHGKLRWRPAPAGAAEDDPGGASWGSRDISQVEIDFWASSPVVQVDLRMEGYRALPPTLSHGQLDLVLEAPYLARLVVDCEGPYPEFPYSLYFELEQGGESIGRSMGSPYLTDKRHEVLIALPTPGKFNVSWSLRRTIGESAIVAGRVFGDLGIEIELKDQMGEQDFSVQLSAEKLLALVQNPPF